MVTLGQKTASEKLASFLLLIARHIDPTVPADAGTVAFDLPLTRGDIADFLGLTIQTVTGNLKLSAAGVIVVNNRHISVKSLARLTRCGAASPNADLAGGLTDRLSGVVVDSKRKDMLALKGYMSANHVEEARNMKPSASGFSTSAP